MNNQVDQKKALEDLQKQFDTQVGTMHEQLKTSHEKKEYTFSVVEKRRLSQIQLMAVFIQDMLDDIINLSVLPRIGITPSPEIRILYDITLGRLTLWTPKTTTNK